MISPVSLTNENEASDNELEIIEPPPQAASRPAPLPAPTSAVDTDEDDDLVIEGTRGSFALIDFPHARYVCLPQPSLL